MEQQTSSPPRAVGGWRERLRRAERLRAGWTLLAALGTLAAGGLVKLSAELSEGELDGFDRSLLQHVIALRKPWLNGPAVDVTALGSRTVLVSLVVFALALLALSRDARSCAQLLLASLGGAFATQTLKQFYERARPDVVSRLVEVSGYSYPSGHSQSAATVYLTLALVAARHVPTRGGRILCIASALLVAFTVGASRSYLGVHYPSDVLAGLLLGSSWALFVNAAFVYQHSAQH